MSCFSVWRSFTNGVLLHVCSPSRSPDWSIGAGVSGRGVSLAAAGSQAQHFRDDVATLGQFRESLHARSYGRDLHASPSRTLKNSF